MKLTILGCGTSTGVPLIHCHCPVCRSRDPKNKRLRASAWLEIGSKSFLIDTSTDFRAQALRTPIPRIDAVFYTHPHADHVHGIDDLRSFNFIQKESIPLYGNAWTCRELRQKFKYIFSPRPVEGGGVPELSLHMISTQNESFEVCGIKVIPISLSHGSKETVGYRFESLAYLTDCSDIAPSALKKLQGLKVLILDCLRLEPHNTHLNLEQALEVVAELSPKKTYLTHLGHDFDYRKTSKKLPKGVALAYDGLKISL